MKMIFTICCGAAISSRRFDTIEAADEAARSMSRLTGHFWYVRTLYIKESVIE